MQKSVLVLLAILGSAFGNGCNNEKRCDKCLKKDGCAWFVDPLNKVAECITDEDCDNDVQSGTPASCTKTSFVASFPDFDGLSASKKAKNTCKVFGKKYKKKTSPPPPPPTDAPLPPGLDCGSAYPAPFDCVLFYQGKLESIEYCGGCACAPELECNLSDDVVAPTVAPVDTSPSDVPSNCGRFWKKPYDCVLQLDDDDFRSYCGQCDCVPTDTECTLDKILRIELGNNSDDDEPPTYLLEGDDFGLDCGAAFPEAGQDCVAQTCDLDGDNCGAPFCAGPLCVPSNTDDDTPEPVGMDDDNRTNDD